jgi:hypothetical protein
MYRFFWSDFNKLEFSQQIFEAYSNIKFHENPSSESRAVAGGRTDRQKRLSKRFFLNFANTPKSLIKLQPPDLYRQRRKVDIKKYVQVSNVFFEMDTWTCS